MTTAQLLLQDFDCEIATARRLLERVPETPAYVPHEKSMPLGRLAMHVATLPLFGLRILTTPLMDMSDPTQKWPDMTFTTRDNLLAAFDKNAAETRAALAASTDDTLAHTWEFRMGDHVISKQPRSFSYRHLFFNHFIHHRGQISVYLRLNNIPLPSIYGPTADEPFDPAKHKAVK